MKDVENSSKARQGSKTKETEHCISRCENFAHLISRCENFAHLISRCEILGPKGAIFAHPKNKVRNLSQGAKTDFKVRNSLKAIFAHHCSRCENFRTVRNSLLAHECHFAHLKAIFAPCESRCEIHSSVRNKVRIP